MTLFGLDSYDLWVMGTGVVCAVACALPGCYLVLRRLPERANCCTTALNNGPRLALMAST